ncbi:hypothetical protein EYF80_031398 [Liparis tanakae]|uniref:Uncharacterized protein n=1 Tax=Liparis tanakae TaxID=230148 RepID=A0A4Z2GXK8_9TELE|nr:hypothetical protein EYF80_031398 [Liparis tanakae]
MEWTRVKLDISRKDISGIFNKSTLADQFADEKGSKCASPPCCGEIGAFIACSLRAERPCGPMQCMFLHTSDIYHVVI